MSAKKRHIILGICIVALVLLQIVFCLYLLPHAKKTLQGFTLLDQFAMFGGQQLLWTGIGILVTGRVVEGRSSSLPSRVLLFAGILALVLYGGMVFFNFTTTDSPFRYWMVVLYECPEVFLFPGMAIGAGMRFRQDEKEV